MMCSTDVSIGLSVCCRLWARLSRSLDPAEEVTAGLLVDVAQGQRVELRLGVAAQPVHEPLHDPGDQVGHHDRQKRRADVENPRPEQGGVPRAVVDAARRDDAVDARVSCLAEDARAVARETRAAALEYTSPPNH